MLDREYLKPKYLKNRVFCRERRSA